MADYKGQTRTVYTEQAAKKAAELASQPVAEEKVEQVESPKKRGRKAKED